MAGSLLLIAIEVAVSAGFEVPGSLGFINPTAVLGGAHCCCYLYPLLGSSRKASQLGLCSGDTEAWLLSKLRLQRTLPSQLVPGSHSQGGVNGGYLVTAMRALRHASGQEGQEDNESWIFTDFLSASHTGRLLCVVPQKSTMIVLIVLEAAVLSRFVPLLDFTPCLYETLCLLSI